MSITNREKQIHETTEEQKDLIGVGRSQKRAYRSVPLDVSSLCPKEEHSDGKCGD